MQLKFLLQYSFYIYLFTLSSQIKLSFSGMALLLKRFIIVMLEHKLNKREQIEGSKDTTEIYKHAKP